MKNMGNDEKYEGRKIGIILSKYEIEELINALDVKEATIKTPINHSTEDLRKNLISCFNSSHFRTTKREEDAFSYYGEWVPCDNDEEKEKAREYLKYWSEFTIKKIKSGELVEIHLVERDKSVAIKLIMKNVAEDCEVKELG
jgi:hypothetical protein